MLYVPEHIAKNYWVTLKCSVRYISLHLDPMTLILKFDLDMVNMYHHTKKQVSMSIHSKVIAQTNRHTQGQTHTHRHDENITSIAYMGGKELSTNGTIDNKNAFQLKAHLPLASRKSNLKIDLGMTLPHL